MEDVREAEYSRPGVTFRSCFPAADASEPEFAGSLDDGDPTDEFAADSLSDDLQRAKTTSKMMAGQPSCAYSE